MLFAPERKARPGVSQRVEGDVHDLRPGGPRSHLIRLEENAYALGRERKAGKVFGFGGGAAAEHVVVVHVAEGFGQGLGAVAAHDVERRIQIFEYVIQIDERAALHIIGRRGDFQVAVRAAGIAGGLPDYRKDGRRGTGRAVGRFEFVGHAQIRFFAIGILERVHRLMRPVGHIGIHAGIAGYRVMDPNLKLAGLPGNHGVALVQGVGVRGYRQRNGTAQQEKTDEV